MAVILIGCTEKDRADATAPDFNRYEAALAYLRSLEHPVRTLAVSDTTCIPLLGVSDHAKDVSYAVYPKLVFDEDADFAADYGRQRLRSCRENGQPLVIRTDRGLQYSRDEDDEWSKYGSRNYIAACNQVSQVSPHHQQKWTERFASSAEEVADATWLIYLSPICGDTLTAAVAAHWDRPGPWIFHFHFVFDHDNSLYFVSATDVHSSLPIPPLEGWPQ